MTSTALNAICPYFTMFPLEFPLTILSRRSQPGDWVMDPFCGRGTTNFASRLLGLHSIGIDSSPVATAIAQAKLANTTPEAILRVAQRILEEISVANDVPEGEFWSWAFEASVLGTICRLREGLMRDCRSDARRALRALLMGALHGPRPKHEPSYFSNQAPRTYAPKPRYAVDYWRRCGMTPAPVDVLGIVATRARRFFGARPLTGAGQVLLGDSRDAATYKRLSPKGLVRWVITSPPYYGMRTYIPDQWLRSWLLGGPPTVDYSVQGQLSHRSPDQLVDQLRQVWRHVGAHSAPEATLVVRFGGINDRKADPLTIITASLQGSGWELTSINCAGNASVGRRQAVHFSRTATVARDEHDIWARWTH